MRLLYLTADPGVPVLGHKGASVHVRELCAAFVEVGVEVHIASPRIVFEGDELIAPAKLHGLAPILPKKHDAPTLRTAVAAQARTLASLCQELEIDAIYERYSLFSAAGVRAAAELGLPHVLEVNAPLREEAARYRTLPHPVLAAEFESEVMTATDRVLAVSDPLSAMLTSDGVDPSKINVVPNGVAAHRFPSPCRDPERFVVGFAGSMKPWHGLDTLLDAIALVDAVHLEVAGHGPQEQLLERLPPDRVTRFGALPHVEAMRLMSRWDVGVAPFHAVDGFWFSALKVLEYMAAGSCAVASDVGDAAELLEDGLRGVVTPPGDSVALADVLSSLAADRERARELGERARTWVAANRSWSANAAHALAALRARHVARAA